MSTATVAAPKNAAAIQTILDTTYGVNVFSQKNQKLSEQLAKAIAETPSDEIKCKVVNIVWDNFAGGDLAEAVAAEILGF